MDNDPEGGTVKMKSLVYRSLKLIDKDENGSDAGERLNQERLESLCILRSCYFIAISMASKIWGTLEKDARNEARRLKMYCIIQLLYPTGQVGIRDSFSIGLHDRMLDAAQAESRLRNVKVKGALGLVSKYLQTFRQSVLHLTLIQMRTRARCGKRKMVFKMDILARIYPCCVK